MGKEDIKTEWDMRTLKQEPAKTVVNLCLLHRRETPKESGESLQAG